MREGNASAGDLGDTFDVVEVSEGRGTRDFAAAWTRGLPAESRLAALLSQAQDLRCEVAVTETGVGGGADLTSLRNLLRAGFRLAYERELYVSPLI